MKVSEIMSSPFYVDEDISLKEVATIMSDKGIGSLIYMNKNEIVGILTEADLLKNFDKKMKLSDVMSKNIITIDKDDDINDAMRLMKENGIKRLPVLSKEKLVGIITLTDIAAHSDELEGDFFFD